ncbi:DUF4232 domain-containing protein [Corynebacteriaceae bacterium 7-707]
MVTQQPQGTPNSTDTATSAVGGSRFRRAGTVGAVGASVVLAVSVLSACSDGDGATDANGGAGTPVQDTASTGESAAPTTADRPDPGQPTATGGDASRCATDALDITLGQSQGAAGSLLMEVDFTNSSSGACTLAGFPGVALVDEAGAPVGAPAVREDNAPGGPVELAPGDTASTVVKISRAENYDEQACGPAPASGLQVIVPEETDTTVLDFADGADGADGLGDVTACTDDSVELLTVQPLTTGA